MLKAIRDELCKRIDELGQIASATGTDADDLRRFAFGKTIPDGFGLDLLADHFRLDLKRRGFGALLPVEEVASKAIQQQFRQELADAVAVLELGLKVIGSTPEGPGQLPRVMKPRGLTWSVVHLCLGIYTKALKHLRSVIALCELGLGDDANITARALFETVLALHFILKPRTPLLEGGKKLTEIKKIPALHCQKCNHIIRPEKSAVKLKRLGTHMRAKLYWAFVCIEHERELDAYLSEGMVTTAAVLGDKATIRSTAKDARRAIGPGWVKRQKEKGYAGVSVRDLAESYKLLPYYLTVYRHQSDAVHGTNAALYFDFDKIDGSLELNLAPDPERIGNVLFIATAVTAGAIQLLDRRLGLGFKKEVNLTMGNLKTKGKKL